MLKEKELNIIESKIKNKIPLDIDEISGYLNIKEKIIKNIFVMYEAFGRKSVESITLSDEEIDHIIKLKYPDVIAYKKH
ncbi:hypothetical protein FYJ27_05460 [Anaerosalibacter bizertensis]|uniref:Uncharacterized protein n=1 Tax=Anaerosalibacter bizertensis TaxID=932217 RepID=A0A844FGS1_9FIRM|nr:hypothetical protein [Anaerosalibacter bizertensis]MSS43179.1 hypothetical protein [Anaerosalibacter bizertensis]